MRKQIIGVFFFVFAYGVCHSQNATELYKQAATEYDAGKYQKAIELLSKAIQLDSTDAKTFHLRGTAEFQLSEFELAIKDCDYAIRLKPKSLYFNTRGAAKMGLNRFYESIEDFDKAISLDPKSKYAYYNRGKAKLGLKEYESAIKDFDKEIEIVEHKFSNHFSKRGLAYVNLGDTTKAINDFTEALKLDSTNLDALSYRSVLFFNQKKYDKALFDVDSYLVLKKNASSYNDKGSALGKMGRIDEAIDNYKKAIEMDNNFEDAHSNLAILYKEKKSYNEAIRELGECIRINPTSVSYIERKAAIEEHIGKYENEILDYEKVILLEPTKVKYYLYLASPYISLGNYDKAISLCQDAIKMESKNAFPYVQLGYVQEELGKYDSAIISYDKAISFNQKGAIYSNKADAEIRVKDFVGAVKDCDSAIHFNPKFKQAYNNRAIAYYYLLKYDSSLKDFERALSIDSVDIYAFLWRGKTYSKISGKKNLAENDFKKAIQLCDKSFKVNPRDAYNYYYRGQAYEELGNLKAAMKDYKKAVEIRKANYAFNKAIKDLQEKMRGKK